MSMAFGSYRIHCEGKIAIEQALSCLECELRFSGTACCPCSRARAVWPLAEWIPLAWPRGTKPTLLC
jgi:hypothetical protein